MIGEVNPDDELTVRAAVTDRVKRTMGFNQGDYNDSYANDNFKPAEGLENCREEPRMQPDARSRIVWFGQD